MNKTEALNILGLTSESSIDEVKKSYRKLALQYHPDRNQGSKESEEQFKKIAEAYACLTDPNYSNQPEFSGFNGFSFNFNEMDEMISEFLFGNKTKMQQDSIKKIPRPGEIPIKLPELSLTNFNVDLVKVLLNEDIEINLQVQKCCELCLDNEDMWQVCSLCHQSGKIMNKTRTPFGHITQSQRCHFCGGIGWKKNKHCKQCNETLIYHKTKTIKFRINKNYVSGSKIKIQKAGNEGWKTSISDLYITPLIVIPDLTNLPEDDRKKLRDLFEKMTV